MRCVTLGFCVSMLATGASAQATPVARYEVDSTPFVAIGGDGSGDAPLLGSVFSATRTAQGFVVADTRMSTLLLLDAQGRLVRSVGRQGQGPGEFMGGLYVFQCAGDSLFVWDTRAARISVFSASGTYARQIPATASRLTCSRAGVMAMLLRPSAPAPNSGATVALMTSIKLVDLTGDSIGTIPNIRWGDRRTLGALTSIAMRGDELFVGTAEEPIIDVYDLRGRQLRQIRFPHEPVRIATAAHERAIESMLSVMRAQGVQNLEQQRAALMARPIPETFPPYYEIAAAPNGVVWLLTTHHTEPVAHLKAVRQDGAIVAEVDLSLGDTVRLLEAGDDYLLLTYVNGDGVVKVGAFRVRAR